MPVLPPGGEATASRAGRSDEALDERRSPEIRQISPTRCQARTRLYRNGRLELEGFPVADISEYPAYDLATIWLDLRGPDPTTSPC